MKIYIFHFCAVSPYSVNTFDLPSKHLWPKIFKDITTNIRIYAAVNQKPLFPVILLIVDCDDLKGDEDEDVCDYNFNFELFCIKEASNDSRGRKVLKESNMKIVMISTLHNNSSLKMPFLNMFKHGYMYLSNKNIS